MTGPGDSSSGPGRPDGHRTRDRVSSTVTAPGLAADRPGPIGAGHGRSETRELRNRAPMAQARLQEMVRLTSPHTDPNKTVIAMRFSRRSLPRPVHYLMSRLAKFDLITMPAQPMSRPRLETPGMATHHGIA